jgi:hypothetical protein
MNYELLIELLTALGIAFLSAMKYQQVKNGGQMMTIDKPLGVDLPSHLLPVVSEGSLPKSIAPEQHGLKKNIKAELDAAASAGVPFDFTIFGANAVLNWNTGDITYK